MAYASKHDLYLVILPEELEEIVRNDDTLIAQMLATAESEARGYLADTFAVEEIFAAIGSDRAEHLVRTICDMAVYYLVARCQAGSYQDDRMERYDRAIKWLKSLAGSELFTELPRREKPRTERLEWGSRRKRNNYR